MARSLGESFARALAVVEQAYYETQDGVITWMRVQCSGYGYQPVPPAGGGAA
jgi:hypothetical protein